jgi:hypothetical protein
VTSPALTRANEELLDASRNGDEAALAVLVERLVRLRVVRRLQGRVDPTDVVREAYLTVRGRFPPRRRAPTRACPSSCGCAWKSARSSLTCTASTWGPRCATPGRKSRCTAGRCRR